MLVTKLGQFDSRLQKQFRADADESEEDKRYFGYMSWLEGELEDRQGKLDMC